ncbi:MAG: hypothetical protein ACFFC7_11675 [Candidatus Hermodarchaeota archaeon]
MAEFKLLRIPIPLEGAHCQICHKERINRAWIMVVMFPKAIITEDLPIVCSECKKTIRNEETLPHPATLEFPRTMPSREEAILAALHKKEVEATLDLKGELVNFKPHNDFSIGEIIKIRYPKTPKRGSRLRRSRPKSNAKKPDLSTEEESENDKEVR